VTFRDDRIVKAEVLAVGPGVAATATGEMIPVDCEPGDTILYDSYGSTVDVTIDDEKFVLIPEETILLKEI